MGVYKGTIDPEFTAFSIDAAVHARRGENWSKKRKKEYEERKDKARAMLRSAKPKTIFTIANSCFLPVMTVRDLHAEYMDEIRTQGAQDNA